MGIQAHSSFSVQQARPNSPSTNTVTNMGEDDAISKLVEEIRLLKEKTAALEGNMRQHLYGTIPREGPVGQISGWQGTSEGKIAVRDTCDFRLIPEDGECNCRCRSLVRGKNAIGRGVTLGMVFAGDVGNLSPADLKTLDEGLVRLGRATFGSGVNDMTHHEGLYRGLLDLFGQVNLRNVIRIDFHHNERNRDNIHRSRDQRMYDAMVTWRGCIDNNKNVAANETIYQLMEFRGLKLS